MSVVSFETTNYRIGNKVEKYNDADDFSGKFLPFNEAFKKRLLYLCWEMFGPHYAPNVLQR